jgi:hypothetical protein
MTHQEKNNIISMITSIIVSVPYLIFIFNKYQAENLALPEELKFWGAAILILIPLRIISEIIVYIVFAILNTIITGEDEVEITDERDNLIALKSTRNSYYMFIIGFVISLIAITVSSSPSAMFMILIITGVVSEFTDILSKIYYYRKGI